MKKSTVVTSFNNKRNIFFYGLLILVACVSMVFTNISYDAEYQMAMAYRFIKGDLMIKEMWEPHQTSAFLCTIFMKLYMTIAGTTTGIVLYMQIVGLLIRSFISIWLYKVIKNLSGLKPAVVAGVLYLLISPKEVLIPEFSNMQIWFATLMMLFIWQYIQRKKIVYLVLAAISLCLGILSYPSIFIVYVIVLHIFIKYSDDYKKDIVIFTGVCVVIGGSFVGYLLINVGWSTIIACLNSALAVEPSHTIGVFPKVSGHILSIAKICGMLVVVGIIAFIIKYVFYVINAKRQGVREENKLTWDSWWFIFWDVLMFFYLINILSVENRGGYAYPLTIILLLGFIKRRLLSTSEKTFYDIALKIGVGNLVATLILSDHVFLQAVPYMCVAVCASVLPIYRWFETIIHEKKWKKYFGYCIHIFLVLIIFRCLYIHIPLYGRAQIYSIVSDIALVRSGPAIGIISDENGVARQRDSMREWKQYIKPGDTIWIVGEPVDTLGYLYEDVNVGAPTVMSTPTYSEALEYYWEVNSEKYPNVVVVASSFGELAWEIRTNKWIQEWLEEEFCADTIIDGSYWRYYIKNR